MCDVAVLISAPRLNKMGQLALGERCILPNKEKRLQVWVVFRRDGFFSVSLDHVHISGDYPLPSLGLYSHLYERHTIA